LGASESVSAVSVVWVLERELAATGSLVLVLAVLVSAMEVWVAAMGLAAARLVLRSQWLL